MLWYLFAITTSLYIGAGITILLFLLDDCKAGGTVYITDLPIHAKEYGFYVEKYSDRIIVTSRARFAIFCALCIVAAPGLAVYVFFFLGD